MSWKIYNGFILKNIKTLEEALKWATKIKKQFNDLADNHWANGIIRLAISKFDDGTINNAGSPDEAYLAQAYNMWINAEEESVKTNQKSYTNMGMELAFYPITLKKKKRIIGIAFCDNEEMRRKFFALDEVDDFSYWNNSDPAEDVLSSDWNVRKDVWNKVFADESTVGDVMFYLKIISAHVRYIHEQLRNSFHEYITDFDNRVASATHNYIEALNPVRQNYSYTEYWKYVKSDEYKKEFDKMYKIFYTKLKKDITLKELTT